MATPSRLDDAPAPARPETPTRHESLVARLVRLGALELELGWAETRNLVIAGTTVAVLALAALAWSAWRLTHIAWPQQTLASMQETWRWLVAQLKSKLTSW